MKIHRKNLIFANVYLIEGKRELILIDSGPPEAKKKMIKFISERVQKGKYLSHILITHAHWDHIGTATGLKEKYGCRIALHCIEKELIEKGAIHIPPPKDTLYARFLYKTLSVLSKWTSYTPFYVDIPLQGENNIKTDEFNLQVMETPGHTSGSVTYLIDSYAFTGDTFLGKNLFLRRPRLSLFVEDREKIFESIEQLLLQREKKIKLYLPGHGNPFTLEDVQKTLKKIKKGVVF